MAESDGAPAPMVSTLIPTEAPNCAPSKMSSATIVVFIPSRAERDSRGGFPNQLNSDSLWRPGKGGSPWQQRLDFETITTDLG